MRPCAAQGRLHMYMPFNRRHALVTGLALAAGLAALSQLAPPPRPVSEAVPVVVDDKVAEEAAAAGPGGGAPMAIDPSGNGDAEE